MRELGRAFRSLFAIALAAGGCGGDAQPRGSWEQDSAALADDARSEDVLRWVGAVDETDVRVAVLTGKGKARLFFCGGPRSYVSTTHWFNVFYDGGEHIEFEEDAWRIHAHLTLGGLIGEVELGDEITRTVRAEEVRSSTLAGLYEGKADCGRLGLIVAQAREDSLPSAQGACTNTTRAPPQEVQPLAPITSESGGIRVQTPGGGGSTLLLRAAALEPL